MSSDSHDLHTPAAQASQASSYPLAEGANGYPAMRSQSSIPSSLFRYRVVKRGMDLLVVFVAMPVLLPVLLLLMAVVRLTSPGPIFFSHRRIAKNGAFFSMWKFRTMCVDSAEVLEQYLAMHPEAACRVDPHPQASARPAYHLRRPLSAPLQPGRAAADLERHYRSHEHCRPTTHRRRRSRKIRRVLRLLLPCQARRHRSVAVSGRSKVSYPHRVQLDCEYVNKWSLLRDAQILLATAKSVVNQDGAY